MAKARIIRSAQRVFDCKLVDSDEVVNAVARANLLKDPTSIVVGDYVELIDNNSVIDSVYERSNEIYRILVRENKKKVTAANCDLLVMVNSMSKPTYKRGLVDRYLARAQQWGIPMVVVFNKADELKKKWDLKFEAARVAKVTQGQFEICSKDPEFKPKVLDQGFSELKALLKGKTCIFLGQSGVGKSKLITALSEGHANLLSSQVGKLGKGSHTTTWSEIVDLDDFSLIDSPGIRSFAMDDLIPEQLDRLFPDLWPHFSACEFKDCEHLDNSAGCSFHRLSADDESSQILASRLESYLKIRAELQKIPSWQRK